MVLHLMFTIFAVQKLNSFYYMNDDMNDEKVALKSFVIDSSFLTVYYNIFNFIANKSKRLLGLHNISIEVPGCEVVYLIRDGCCFYPNFFTVWYSIFPSDGFIAQVAASSGVYIPLAFLFTKESEILFVKTSSFKFRFLVPFLKTETIPLIRQKILLFVTNLSLRCLLIRKSSLFLKMRYWQKLIF